MRRVVDHLQAVRIEMTRTVDDLVAVSVHTDVNRVDDRKALLIVERLTSHLVRGEEE